MYYGVYPQPDFPPPGLNRLDRNVRLAGPGEQAEISVFPE
jgi:hypothetical protein